METDDYALEARLDELEHLETVSGFSRTFYRLTARLVGLAEEQRGLRLALAGLLDVELRYHRELQGLTESPEVGLGDLQAASERHRIGLQAVYQYAQQLQGLERMGEVSRDLVAAECCYHLRRTAEVVAALERVVRAGVNQPLIQFALGYNRYLLALETCTGPTAVEGELELHDPASFRVQCLRAVSALEDGLKGTELDAQLYWWIGLILDAAGLTEAAQDAYDRGADPASSLACSDEEAAGHKGSGRHDAPAVQAISDEEVWRASKALQGAFDPAWLFGGEPDKS